MESSDSDIVRASPTKRFFISILVKDLYLIDSIVELVDNSVDSARAKFGTDLSAALIALNFDKSEFKISDNAAGIDVDVARNYAFRFGRAEGAPSTPGSVGEFGVGMKRALFKLGRKFNVESITATNSFVLPVDVDDWEREGDQDPSTWAFKFSHVDKNANQQTTGTTIKVERLYDTVALEFDTTSFATRLANKIAEAHSESLAAGLQITVNNRAVNADTAKLLNAEGLTPIHRTFKFDVDGKEIKVTIAAGVEQPKLSDAGWYVYCNGRMIRKADKSSETGWDTELEDGQEKIPKPHWQFRRFRGYVFFESDFHDVLPWNTTKTNLDVESPAYRRIKSDMIAALREVITFLNRVDEEAGHEEKPLTDLIESAARTPVSQLSISEKLVYTATANTGVVKKEVRISYTRDSEVVEKVMEALGVKNRREAGELTFNYYVDSEGLNGG